MPKELRELLDQINAKKTEVKNFVAENKIEGADKLIVNGNYIPIDIVGNQYQYKKGSE